MLPVGLKASKRISQLHRLSHKVAGRCRSHRTLVPIRDVCLCRLMRIRGLQFVVWLGLLTLTACAPPEPNKAAQLLLFNGTGTSPNDVRAFEQILKDMHLTYADIPTARQQSSKEPPAKGGSYFAASIRKRRKTGAAACPSQPLRAPPTPTQKHLLMRRCIIPSFHTIKERTAQVLTATRR
jgi:hypothetical protein